MNTKNLWIGLGVAATGAFVLNSVTFTKGTVYCYGDPPSRTRYASLFITDLSFGLGLGADTGFVALIGINYAAPSEMAEKIKNFEDFDFALDLGPLKSKAVTGILRSLSKIPITAKFEKIAGVIEKGAHFRESHEWITAFGDAIVKDAASAKLDIGKRRVIAIALPGCGWSLEAYIGMKGTDTRVMSWGTCNRVKGDTIALAEL
jgi:hypothetical protein